MITTTNRNHHAVGANVSVTNDNIPHRQPQQATSETLIIVGTAENSTNTCENSSLQQYHSESKPIEIGASLETAICMRDVADEHDIAQCDDDSINNNGPTTLTEESEHSSSSAISTLTPQGAAIRYEREQQQNITTPQATNTVVIQNDTTYKINEADVVPGADISLHQQLLPKSQLSERGVQILQPILQSTLLSIRSRKTSSKNQNQHYRWNESEEMTSLAIPLFQSASETSKSIASDHQRGSACNNYTQQFYMELQCHYNVLLGRTSTGSNTGVLEDIIATMCWAITKPEINAFDTNILLSAIYSIVEKFDNTFIGKDLQIDLYFGSIIDAIVKCSFEETSGGTGDPITPSLGASSQHNLDCNNLNDNSNKVSLPPINPNPLSSRRRSTSALVTPPANLEKQTVIPVEPRPLPIRSAASFSENKVTDDELTVYKLLQLCLLIIQKVDENNRLKERNHEVIEMKQLQGVLDLCWHIQHKAQAVSCLLKQMAADVELQIIRIFFQHPGTVYDPVRFYILDKVLKHLIATPEKTSLPTASNHDARYQNNTVGLSNLKVTQCLSVLKEIIGIIRYTIPQSDGSESTIVEQLIKNQVIRNVISLAVQTNRSQVLQSCIEIVNVLLSMYGLRQFQCEFEVFIHSALLRRLVTRSDQAVCEPDSKNDIEERYLVLQFLQDVCCSAHVRYSSDVAISILDIYLMYDCDCNCTNMFESIVSVLSEVARPVNWTMMDTTIAPSSSTSKEAELSTVASNRGSGSADITVAGKTVIDQAKSNATHTRLALNSLLSILELIEQLPNQRTANKDVQICDDLYVTKKNRKRALCEVVKSFNSTNPDKGEWLNEAMNRGLIDAIEDYASAAKLLFMSPLEIDKDRVGHYLSRGPETDFPFQALLRTHFVSLYDFRELSFPAALRKFLSKFRLPGEAQCIDRLMEAFSKEYFKQQSDTTIFRNSDAVFVLSFSTIMLNTDLHNRTIKADQRMTVEQFLKNNRGINAGEDLPDDFLSDLYDQIRERELQLITEPDQFLTGSSPNRNTDVYWQEICSKELEMDPPIAFAESSTESAYKAISEDVMRVFATYCAPALLGLFSTSTDDAVLVRVLRAVQQLLKLATQCALFFVVNDVLQVFLQIGQDYVSKHICEDASPSNDLNLNASTSDTARTKKRTPSIDTTTISDDVLFGIDSNPIPFGLLSSRTEFDDANDIKGSTGNRGLLAMDCSFVYIRNNTEGLKSAWPALVKCLCKLRDARALPKSLSDLDDFADSSGNVLPLSTFASSSQSRLQYHYRSLSDKENQKQKSWFRSLFRKSKFDQMTDMELNVAKEAEPSIYITTLLSIAESSGIENVVQMGSSKLPDEYIGSILDVLDNYPFDNDPVGEQHAIFTVELAARALLSNHERAELLFLKFLGKFEQTLCKRTTAEGEIPEAPFVIERIVVTILRCCIHLYERPILRPHLRASLQLLSMTLPRSFIHVIADRISCGLAIILRASYPYFEHQQEWSFMNDMLDGLAHYESSRVFVFDGIASTVEYAMPNFNPNATSPSHFVTNDSLSTLNTDSETPLRPQLTVEACGVLARILTRFVMGFYHGDQSLIVPAMLCLEKVYRRKVEILLVQQQDDQNQQSTRNHASIDGEPSASHQGAIMDIISYAPDKDLWQNVAVAIYSVCRSSIPDASMIASKCFRRVVVRVNIDAVSPTVWITMLFLMVHKQPTTVSGISRSNTFALLGQLLLRVMPVLSHNIEYRDDIEEFILQFAALAEENIQTYLSSATSNLHHHSRRRDGSATRIMFDKTFQTLTYICNHIISDEWNGDRDFTIWMNETLLVPIELASSSMSSNGHGKVVTTFDNAMELDDVSEISDSVAGDEY